MQISLKLEFEKSSYVAHDQGEIVQVERDGASCWLQSKKVAICKNHTKNSGAGMHTRSLQKQEHEVCCTIAGLQYILADGVN